MTDSRIIYTHTDEAPLLATYSFLPIIEAYAAKAGVSRRDARHLAGRPGSWRASPTCSPRTSASPTTSPSSAPWPRRPRPTSSSCPTSAPPPRSSRRPSPSSRSRASPCPDYPDNPQSDEDEGRARPLRQGQGQRGQPGAARGQLRPPRAGVGEELRAQAPALDGRVEPGLEDQRRAHDRRRLPLQREVRGHREGGLAAHRARQPMAGRGHRGAQGVGAGRGRRGRRRHLHEHRGAAGLPARADRSGPRTTTCCSRCT